MTTLTVKQLTFNGSEHYHALVRARKGTDLGYDAAARTNPGRVLTPQGWFTERERQKPGPKGPDSRHNGPIEFDELDWTPKKYREMDANFCTAMDTAIAKGLERAQRNQMDTPTH